MPGKVKVKVLAGRHLPVMDRSNDTTDAYVEVKLGSTVCKTDVCRKSLNPQWNSEWFKFEMDDLELQDEPLQIRLMDYDTYSANDAIGKVYIDLNPLLTNPSKTKEPSGRAMSGWIPIYDTMHGIRGEVNLLVKVELFSDLNKFRQSSCGVKFFFTQAIPDGYLAIQLHGFVEELVVNDDPEYQWIDKIRTPRASNEARQLLFLKLAGEVQRRVGLKALELGGNAVIGYRVCFDLEGESGIVVRGIGTAATLTKIMETASESAASKEFFSAGHQLLAPSPAPKSHSKLNLILPSPKISPAKGFDNVFESVLSTEELEHNANNVASACLNLDIANNMPNNASNESLHEINENINTSTAEVIFPNPHAPIELKDNVEVPLVSRPTKITSFAEEEIDKPLEPPNINIFSPIQENLDQLNSTITTRPSIINCNTEQFIAQRKRRASKKRDKYSTSALLKRVNNFSYDRKEGPTTKTGFKIKNELVNFFRKRRRFLSGDTESSQEKEAEKVKTTTSIYRKPRIEQFFFFKPKKHRSASSRRSSSLRRSSSESFSLERISIESLPSLNNEDIGLNFDWSQIQIPTSEVELISPSFPLAIEQSSKSKPFDPDNLLPAESNNDLPSIYSTNSFPSCEKEGHNKPNPTTIMQTINDLGYSRGDKPLKLYISSLDALVVCAASSSNKESSSSCTITESRSSNNLISVTTSENNLLSNLVLTTTNACHQNTVRLNSKSANNDKFPSSENNSSLQKITNFTENATNLDEKKDCSFREFDNTNYARNRDAVSSSSGNVPEDNNVPQFQHSSSIASKNSIEEHSSNIAARKGSNQLNELSQTSSGKPPTGQVQTAAVTTTTSQVIKSTETRTSQNQQDMRTIVMGSKSEVFTKTVAPSSVREVSSTSAVHARNGSTGNPAHPRTHTISQNKVSPMPPVVGSSGSTAGCRRSSESDLSTPPTGLLNSTIEAIITHNKTITAKRLASGTDHFDLLEYPFVTIGQLPPRFIQHIGGAVSARSVKLLERISNLEEPESRDSWWNEIRMEIRSHARSICCNVILGYDEQTTICDDVCILSATGTAAVVNSATLSEMVDKLVEIEKPEKETKEKREKPPLIRTDTVVQNMGVKARHTSSEDVDPCIMCHLPYHESAVPFPVKMAKCQICKKGRVPDLLLATIGLPVGLPICGKMNLIQSHVFRIKKDTKGESSAKEVSDSVPFLEYELHRRLINKLKVRGMNAIFSLQVQICLGENLMVGVATGTAVCLPGLPVPEVPKITGGNMKADTQKVNQFQKVVQDTYDRNREFYGVTSGPLGQYQISNGNGHQSSDDEESKDEAPNADLATGNKDAYVLEVDDAEDIDIISDLVDPSPPSAFEMNNLDSFLGYDDYRVASQQVFTQIWRCRVSNMSLRQLAGYFDRLLRSISFKLRALMPCVLNKLRFRVELPEPDEIQISIVGTALGLARKLKIGTQEGISPVKHSPGSKKSIEDTEMIFNMECDGVSNNMQMKDSGDGIPALTEGIAHNIETSTTPSPLPSASVKGENTPDELNNVQGSGATVPIPITNESISGGHAVRSPTFPSLLTCNLPSSPQISPLPPIPRSLVVPNLARTINKTSIPGKGKYVIEITTMSTIPGYRIDKYLGNLNCFFIRETTSVKELGGPSGFVHNAIVEVLAIIRAHVAALGGNALVSYFMTELSLLHNPHKNQGQCLINVGGDVVFIIPTNSIDEEKSVEES